MTRRYAIPANREAHILVGDKSGGGHRYGANCGKSEFPQSWSDQDILTAIEDVANDPHLARQPTWLGRIKVIGIRKGISITVIADPANWVIVTGYPK